ncbi:MAG TPA: hypothetical protein VHL57_01105, partial [Flavobacteriales bacterium]|nr:hypothetical protein [Flavobacteriales bacterium]
MIIKTPGAARAERTPNGPRARIRANAGTVPPAKTKITWKQAFLRFIWPRRKNVLLGLLLIV